jgi:hypothetical protein
VRPHAERVEAQRLLALTGDGDDDRRPFGLVRLATGQPPVGMKQDFEMLHRSDASRSCPRASSAEAVIERKFPWLRQRRSAVDQSHEPGAATT